MLQALTHRSPASLDALTGPGLLALLDTALSLRQADVEGRPMQPLRGKNIAVMGGQADDAAVQAVTHAAQALGARVAHILQHAGSSTGTATAHDTARLLGRLYDAIDCEDMPLSAVQDLERGTGRPVFNGLGAATHPVRALCELMAAHANAGPQPDHHHYVMQAVLCSALG
ncbi:MAG: hypothetical protein ABW190_14145 [Rhizobacter sp.]